MNARGDDHAGPAEQVAVSVDLWKVLEEAQRVGFIGHSSLGVAVRHAQGFASALEAAPGGMLDLGSGAGLPGLVLLELWPGTQAVLLDSQQRKSDFLRWAVATLGLSDRAQIVGERAEVAGRSARLRGQFDLVVSRGFGRPAVTAECAAPFLDAGGKLVVSEPPGGPEFAGDGESERWPSDGLAPLGLVRRRTWTEPYGYQELLQESPCPERFPRRAGVPAKRPLF